MLLALLSLACTQEKSAPAGAAAVKDAGVTKHVRVLITGYETGELPIAGPKLLEKWSKEESWPEALVLSTGDMFSGNAISSVFFGESSAEFAKAMKYRAAALGNHDLDLGLETLQKFAKGSDITFLAANLKDKAGAEHPLKLSPYLVFERSGAKVGVIGLTSDKTLTTTVSGRASGLEQVPLETALPQALTAAKAEGAQVFVVLIDDCFPVVKAILDAHADWKVDLVVGSHCDEAQEAKGANTLYFTAGAKLADYVRAEWTMPPDAPTTFAASRKTVAPSAPGDADMTLIAKRWKAKLEAELGQTIGYSKAGFKDDSKELRTWVASALRDQAKADAGLINRRGIRSGLPKGPITKASVYSMMPFENAVLTLKVTGEQLNTLKANPEAALVLPAKVDPAATYTLATTEYLYFGGDNLGLQALDPNPETTGQMWQTPVIEWTLAKKTDEKNPLDGKVK